MLESKHRPNSFVGLQSQPLMTIRYRMRPSLRHRATVPRQIVAGEDKQKKEDEGEGEVDCELPTEPSIGIDGNAQF
jgi:hypothetical protein